MLGKRSAQRSLFEPLMLPHRVPEDSIYGRMGQVIDFFFRDEKLGEMYCLDRGGIKGIGARTNQTGILRGSAGCLKGLT